MLLTAAMSPPPALLRGARRSPPRGAGVGARRAATTAMLPPLFSRLVIPNPHPAPAVARTLLELLQAHPKWELKKSTDHGEPAVPRMRLHIACHDKGHAVLEALQQELYEEGEKGCRVRRESQAKFSLVCEGVEVLLNDSHHDITVDVPIAMEADAEAVKRADALLKRVEKTAHDTLHAH